jgi:hypothetical protein
MNSFLIHLLTLNALYCNKYSRWNTTTLFPQCSFFATEFRESLYFISSPSSWQQSLPVPCLGFFYLILQRARPLIYRADIACELKQSAIIRRTAVSSRIPSLFHRTVLDRVADMQSTLSNRLSRYLILPNSHKLFLFHF